jgi:hypothetical protein
MLKCVNFTVNQLDSEFFGDGRTNLPSREKGSFNPIRRMSPKYVKRKNACRKSELHDWRQAF